MNNNLSDLPFGIFGSTSLIILIVKTSTWVQFAQLLDLI
jgi:hypothetical protein